MSFLKQLCTKKNIPTPDKTVVPLIKLKNGQSAVVVELKGGHQFTGKLESLGIVPNITIVKKSAGLMRGPIVLSKGAMQIAIGYGLAQRVMVSIVDI